jgi:2-polyprenyl-3-methyl-5-hydroxy-6-metoxy-1,4-benzoquinol methylase
MRDFNKIDFYIQRQRIGLIEKHIPDGSYLLDVGCGFYPQNLLSLEKKVRKAVGIDRDIPSHSPSGKISFVKYTIEKELPFPENEFDCITLLAILEHMDYPEAIIGECYRVCKPGGRLVITVPSNYSKPILLSLAALAMISREEIYDHKHYFSQKQLEKILAAAKFEKIVSRSYNLFLNVLFIYKKTPLRREQTESA